MLMPAEKIRELLIDNLGEPDDYDALTKYISFVIENEVVEETELYCEFHHILPSSVKTNDFTVKLTYNNHCYAHLLLFLTYNSNAFHRTLNFMKPELSERGVNYKKSLKKAREEGWKKFKNTDKYAQYIEARKLLTSIRMKNGFASELSKRRFDNNPNARKEISDHFKNKWSDPEYKERVRKSMILGKQTDAAKARMSASTKKRYEMMSEDEKKIISEKMTIVNNQLSKREDASKKIKEKWKDPEFKEKMSKRKHGSSNSVALKLKWADPVWKAKILALRKLNYQLKKSNETK